jgi:hypothetical protein
VGSASGTGEVGDGELGDGAAAITDGFEVTEGLEGRRTRHR